jgi:hypothetical protein
MELKLKGGPISPGVLRRRSAGGRRSIAGIASGVPRYGAPPVLAEPIHALTDLLLGVVALALAVRLRGAASVHRHWRAAFWWSGIAALAGAVHHGLIVRWPDVADARWAVVSVLVVAVSFLLAGTVDDVLGGRRAGTFWLLRSLGILAYVVVAATGHAGILGNSRQAGGYRLTSG